MSAQIRLDDATEWLEADGLGGFASGTTIGFRTRRYHALLLAATTPPTGRMVLVMPLARMIFSHVMMGSDSKHTCVVNFSSKPCSFESATLRASN